MNDQSDLFASRTSTNGNATVPSVERFQGAIVFSAIGDALGWPTEFLGRQPRRNPSFEYPVKSFVRWTKLVGGRWWGYRDEISPGQYSDDTQLAIAVVRSLSATGEFQPDRFAYLELPLWLQYERGGGKSIKTAARSLLRRQADWFSNFYKLGDLDYRNAGANGAAMRNLPIALSSYWDESRMVRDSFFNSIITHGHPRAILGSMLLGHAVRFALTEKDSAPDKFIDCLRNSIDAYYFNGTDDVRIKNWIRDWDKASNNGRTFASLFQETRQEAHKYLTAIPEYLSSPTEDYYDFVGATNPSTKGSGLSTVCAAIFQFAKRSEEPVECLLEAINLLGSDTDTIGAFLGGLLGARHGLDAIPDNLLEEIQDREYLLGLGRLIRRLSSKEVSDQVESDEPLQRDSALVSILAWEVGLHEMFWDAITVGGKVIHPTLGQGTITQKQVKDIAREGYVAKLINILFDCGQTCVFHSRVENETRVFGSFGKELVDALKDVPLTDKPNSK